MGSQKHTPKYLNVGTKNNVKTIFPMSSIILENKGVILYPKAHRASYGSKLSQHGGKICVLSVVEVVELSYLKESRTVSIGVFLSEFRI